MFTNNCVGIFYSKQIMTNLFQEHSCFKIILFYCLKIFIDIRNPRSTKELKIFLGHLILNGGIDILILIISKIHPQVSLQFLPSHELI